MDILLRKYRNHIVTDSIGVLALGVWTIIKALSYYLFDVFEIDLPFSSLVGKVAFWAFLVVMLLCSLSVRAYVCLTAVAVSRGKRRSAFYLVLMTGMILIAAGGIPTYFTSMGEQFALTDRIASILVDLTDIFALSSLLYTSVRYRRLCVKV